MATDVWRQTEVQEALAARDFGRLCHLVRVRSSLRQSDMAELTGLSQAFLSMLETGVRRLANIDRIVRLLEGLEVPIELTGPMLRAPTVPAAVPFARAVAAGYQSSEGHPPPSPSG
ncbi:helix-turn-helix domain-containing protein [Streptomyces lunaelactis]|uniref:helix-turn-helix domain-containing protein n=1 Tax=Streptomyces lunaelactis TaxID=1535768 RepID=UPI00158565C6|nr:helix-turn-helix transcriptional regulator [Streptomyces lunaelactis]